MGGATHLPDAGPTRAFYCMLMACVWSSSCGWSYHFISLLQRFIVWWWRYSYHFIWYNDLLFENSLWVGPVTCMVLATYMSTALSGWHAWGHHFAGGCFTFTHAMIHSFKTHRGWGHSPAWCLPHTCLLLYVDGMCGVIILRVSGSFPFIVLHLGI